MLPLPRPRNQLHRIEADPDEQIALVDDRLLDGGVREDAGEPLVGVGDDPLGLVGDHRGYVTRGAQRANGGGVRGAAGAKTDEQQRLARGARAASRAATDPPRRDPLLELEEGIGETHRQRRRRHVARTVHVHRSRPAVRRLVERTHEHLQGAVRAQAAGPLRDRRHQRRVIDALMLERGDAADCR